MCDEAGFVSRKAIMALGDDDEQDMKDVAETVTRDGIFFSFENFDADSSGGLTYDEFGLAAKALGFHIDPANLQEQCAAIDTTGDGIIDELEFVKFIKRRRGAYRGETPRAPRRSVSRTRAGPR